MTGPNTWEIDDDVLRLVQSVADFGGVDPGFIAASFALGEREAREALERLEARHVLRSCIVTSSGGSWRVWGINHP